MPLPGQVKQILLNNLDALDVCGDTLKLRGWQFAVLEL